MNTIDVLQVMDDQIGVIHPHRSAEELEWYKRVVSARAAIAELIVAADVLTESCNTESTGWARAAEAVRRAKGGFA